MSLRARGLLASVASHVPSALVLVLLAGVGVVGYLNDWKLPRLFGAAPPAADAGDDKPDPPEGAADPAAGPVRIHLSEEAARKSDIETEAAVERPMNQVVHAHGVIQYDQTHYARLVPRAAGVVRMVYRQNGEAVHQGDLLALVESADVGRAKASFMQSLVMVEAKEKNLQAVQKQAAVVPGVVPELTLREAEAQLRDARARLFADQQALFNLGLPVAVSEVTGQSEEKVMRRLRLLGLPDSAVAALDANTASANLLPVTSPLDGVVVSRDAAVGEAATANSIFTVADTRKVWIDCDIRLEDVGLLAPGQQVIVRADGASEDAPTGKLIWISAEADDKTHTVKARAEVPNSDGKLRPNTPFEGGVIVGGNPHAVVVAGDALQWDRREALLFVRVADEEYEARRVKVGLRDGDFREIASGLRVGEAVVVRGSHVLKSEMLKDRIAGDD